MKKPLFATLLGGVLGIFDGLTALFTPEVRDQIVGIVIGSTIKGILTGVIIGFFATRVRSLAIGTGLEPAKSETSLPRRARCDKLIKYDEGVAAALAGHP